LKRITSRCIVHPRLQNQAPGLVSWLFLIGDIKFLCRAFGYISMVGWAGASQDAPVSDEAGKTNSVQFTTRKIGLFGGE